MTKLVLKDHRLSFIDTGVKKWHLRSAGGTPENPMMDISSFTIGACHMSIPSGQLIKERERDEELLCGHCMKTVRRYPASWIEEVEI